MARIRTRSLLSATLVCALAGPLGACASAGSAEEDVDRGGGRVLPDVGATVPDTTAVDATIVRDVAEDTGSADTATDVSTRPDAQVDSGVDATTDARPDVPSDVVPDAAPDVQLDVTQDTRPDTAQDAAQDTRPDTAPDVAQDTRPDTAPDVTPDVAPDVEADTAPDVTPDVVLVEICNNAIDDDDDGTIDCGDSDCADDPACTGTGEPCGPVTVATVGVNTATASSDDVETTCAGLGGPEAVFRFTPTIAGTYCLRTNASAVADTVLEGRLDCADPATLLGCFDDNDDGLFAESDLIAEAGMAYDLIVESYNGTAGDSVTLTIEEGSCVDAGPGFETCNNPFVVSAYDSYSGPAFSDDHVGSCSSPFVSYEAVIEFVAPETTRVCADTIGSTNDTVLWVQTSCDPATEIVCEDDTPGLGVQSGVSWDAVAGQSYFVFIEEYESDDFIGEAFFAYNISACP